MDGSKLSQDKIENLQDDLCTDESKVPMQPSYGRIFLSAFGGANQFITNAWKYTRARCCAITADNQTAPGNIVILDSSSDPAYQNDRHLKVKLKFGANGEIERINPTLRSLDRNAMDDTEPHYVEMLPIKTRLEQSKQRPKIDHEADEATVSPRLNIGKTTLRREKTPQSLYQGCSLM